MDTSKRGQHVNACRLLAQWSTVYKVECAMLINTRDGIPLRDEHSVNFFATWPPEAEFTLPPPWQNMLDNAQECLYTLAHSHTNRVPPTKKDLGLFVHNPALEYMIVTAGGVTYYIHRTPKSVCDWPMIQKDLKLAVSLKALDKNEHAQLREVLDVYGKVLPMYGFAFGRY